MTTRFASLLLSGVLVATGLSAQTKVSGTATCKPDPSTPVVITDQPNHSFGVGRAQCTWTKFEVAGVPYKDGISTDLDEVIGDRVSFHGVHVATAVNGDVTVSRYQGAGKLKDGKPADGEGTWDFTSGTGKFKGIKGKGTFKGKANPDGTMTYQIAGEYKLP